MTGPADSARSTLVAYAMLALASLFWAGNHILGRAIAGHVPPLAIATLRWIVPVLLMLPFAIPHLRRDWSKIRSHWPILLFLAITGTAIFGVLQYVALQYTSALNMTVLNSFSPVMMALWGGILFRDRVSGLQAFGIALSLAGVLVIVSKAQPDALLAMRFNQGDLIILFNMSLWGIYSACLRKRPPIHWMSFMLVLATISTLATTPFWLAEHWSGIQLQSTPTTWGALAYACIFPSLVATVFWNRSVEVVGPIRAGATMHLIPIYGAVLASLLLGEQLQPFHLAGFVLILTGVLIATRR